MRWLQVVSGLPHDLVDFVFPPACTLCNAPPAGGPLCATCVAELAVLPGAACSQCRLFADGSGRCPLGHESLVVRSLGLFDAHYRVLLHALKFHGDFNVGRWLGRRMGDALLTDGDAGRFAGVVPVPLHPARERERGYNQSTLLAREVASVMKLPCLELLQRQRNTPSQTSLNRAQRQSNVTGAFIARSRPPEAPLLLVDDVLTTGATLEACASALALAGSGRVAAVTAALAESPAGLALAA